MIATELTHKIFENFDAKKGFKAHFLSFYLSREEWAQTLGSSRTSFWRWEMNIIRLIFPLLADYNQEGGDFLDNYQRFVLSIIHAQKQGWIDGKKRSNQEIKSFLRSSYPHIKRSQFVNWIGEDNVQS
jgi:hypothetical protein